MPFDFSGKKILVTGAGRGIGRALVKTLVEAGGEVFALSLTKENLDSLVQELPAVHPIQVDLSDWETTRREVDKIGPLDGLVNNAMTFYISPALEVSKESLQKVLDVNLMAAINVTQSVGKKMVAEGKGGSIVNISSVNGLNPMMAYMPYDISKAGLDMVTKQFSLELGPHKIRVNSVNPTVVITEVTREFIEDPEMSSKLLSHTPLGRFAEVSECTDLIMFLLSDHSTMITGTTNRLDGGLLSNISV